MLRQVKRFVVVTVQFDCKKQPPKFHQWRYSSNVRIRVKQKSTLFKIRTLLLRVSLDKNMDFLSFACGTIQIFYVGLTMWLAVNMYYSTKMITLELQSMFASALLYYITSQYLLHSNVWIKLN